MGTAERPCDVYSGAYVVQLLFSAVKKLWFWFWFWLFLCFEDASFVRVTVGTAPLIQNVSIQPINTAVIFCMCTVPEL